MTTFNKPVPLSALYVALEESGVYKLKGESAMVTCKTCRWFHDLGVSPDTTYECRKRAPAVWERPQYGPRNFPVVAPDDWCGDHETPPDAQG